MSPDSHKKRSEIRAHVVSLLEQTGLFVRVDEYLRLNLDSGELPAAQVYFDDGDVAPNRFQTDARLVIAYIGMPSLTDKDLDELAAGASVTLDASSNLNGLVELFQLASFSYDRSPEVPLASLTLIYNTTIED